MTVFLRNLQKRVIFDTAVLIRDATYLMRLLRVEKFDVSLVCTGGDLIKSLNLKYRRRNIQTDVLAFPYFENLKPGVIPNPSGPEEYNLGDIILGMRVIEKDCQEDNRNIQEHLSIVVAHGLCHLLGYSHETKENLSLMNQKEAEILKGLNDKTGYKTSPMTPSIHSKQSKFNDEVETFLQYQYHSPTPAGSPRARTDKILQRYVIQSQKKK